MPLTIRLENETGGTIREMYDLSDVIVRFANSETTALMKYVDPFGNTTFNQLQLDELTADVRRMEEIVPEARELGAHLRDLFALCASTPHTYVKFYGD